MWHVSYLPDVLKFWVQSRRSANPENGVMLAEAALTLRVLVCPGPVNGAVQSSFRDAAELLARTERKREGSKPSSLCT